MSELNALPGVVLENAQMRLTDTREMPWKLPAPGEMFHGTGAKIRELSHHEDGWLWVYQVFLPPGARGVGHGGKPDRHYHKTVREWAYVLFGELALVEYDDLDDVVGRRVLYREGFFLDRKPNSVFGLDPDRPSETGVMLLEWRTGPRSSTQEAGSEEETVSLPFPGSE
jgi:hypothetical protein